MFTGSAA
ncbi:hypothetical protein YPPY100_2455, partial [Yersinia pestis PY-100]